MRFSEALALNDPAHTVFMVALETVYDQGDGVTEHIDRLAPEARLVYLLWCLDGELHNGGFDQLFTNSLGNHCLEILKNLEIVGATNTHGLLTRAISWFPNSSPSIDRMLRWSQYETFSDDPIYQDEIDDLDMEFWEYKDDLASLIYSYMLQYPNASIKA